MKATANSRRNFLKETTALAGTAFLAPYNFYIQPTKPKLMEEIIGHGDFKYRVHKEWGDLNPSQTPVKNCHEMVMDSQGRLIMITDETKNNIIIYDKSGKLLSSWGDRYPGGHGLTLFNEGGEDVLFISDPDKGQVDKVAIDGSRKFMTLKSPYELGIYKKEEPYKPTETAIAPNGDIYVADGYGHQYIIQYDAEGNYIRHFGGKGDGDAQFSTAHGVAIDTRNPDNLTLLCTSRAHNAFKRFTLDGKYLETIFLPGAYVCRPVIDDENLYAGVCWSRLKYLNQTPDSGFVTILDKDNKVVSNPGGTEPEYRNGELQLMVQQQPLFNHCHDVCIDEDKNIYVCQWNANQTYPIKLERV
ncbi:twin-arginine translocation signal domain-containing protein [Tunicatimonas pelagia]|uniref:twin-arginine translocation signal domain-containing protein n=1 Tax=Tunicatimonas pelagia TaxID=931531 RepID=UPI00266653FC|nr:twin-arginine translocation signal domain-containing protein [Tunicatimonas pelagia]WKN45621.1 twin-arginine translocation signal domain-containing protein [Tunicatimonas pelagia]